MSNSKKNNRIKRFAAHYVYCKPGSIVAKGVVEVNGESVVTRIFSLNDFPEEIHTTIFYNGILIPPLFENENPARFSFQLIFEVLDQLHHQHPFSIEIGASLPLYLLEDLSLTDKKILPETTLVKIL